MHRLIPVAFLLALFAVGCDPGATVTWVNEGSQPVDIYLGTGPDDFDVSVPPHAEKRVATIRQAWQDVVVVRDHAGRLLLQETLTWDELKARDFRFVITEAELTPTATPASS